MSVRLLAVRRRQRSATRSLAAKRAAGVLFEQLGQLLAHAVRHAAFDWLRCPTKASIKHFLDRGHAHSLALLVASMRAFLNRYFRRKRLKPVVSALPAQLVKSFAAKDHCTFGQATRVIQDLHLPQSVQPYAYAAVCDHRELENSLHLSAEDYKRLRAELFELFNLRNRDFTIKDLLKERRYDQGKLRARVARGWCPVRWRAWERGSGRRARERGRIAIRREPVAKSLGAYRAMRARKIKGIPSVAPGGRTLNGAHRLGGVPLSLSPHCAFCFSSVSP